ncbi:MAG: hypothetical protein KME21_02865 [Desmonostoc vinosum HA7617-LM4]|nr:hypothetical protein [Desmonostoc vinosum HA7617-LM4]
MGTGDGGTRGRGDAGTRRIINNKSQFSIPNSPFPIPNSQFPKIKNAPEFSLGLNQGASTIHIYWGKGLNPERYGGNAKKIFGGNCSGFL